MVELGENEGYVGSAKISEKEQKQGTTLAVRITPRQGKNAIVGILADGTVKIHLTAAPVAGGANLALIRFLSKVFDVPARDIALVAGHSGRNKRISINNVDPGILQAVLLANLEKK